MCQLRVRQHCCLQRHGLLLLLLYVKVLLIQCWLHLLLLLPWLLVPLLLPVLQL